MAGIVLFCKNFGKNWVWHMVVYVIEFVIILTIICFVNNIKSLLNVA